MDLDLVEPLSQAERLAKIDKEDAERYESGETENLE